MTIFNDSDIKREKSILKVGHLNIKIESIVYMSSTEPKQSGDDFVSNIYIGLSSGKEISFSVSSTLQETTDLMCKKVEQIVLV